MDELSQLDELIESDILEALGQEIPENIEKEESINTENLEREEEITLQDVDILDEEITLEDLDDQVDVTSEINIQNESPLTEELNSVPVANNDAVQKIDTTINTNDLGTLLSQLLANKTIEITIKIKD